MAWKFSDKISGDIKALVVLLFITTISAAVCWTCSLFISWLGVVVILSCIHWCFFRKKQYRLNDNESRNTSVVIVGAGFSGLCMAIKLQEANVRFKVLEKSSHLGGTWWDNQYPGCACDIMAHLYSYSFFPNPFWSNTYVSQPEILRYLEKVADHYQLWRHITFDTKVEIMRFNKDGRTWSLKTSHGETISCKFLVSGIGALHVPKMPNIRGMDEFRGESFHTSHWKKNVELSGKRVGVIGTGASAVQVVPSILKAVQSLHVFQRTPVWCGPKLDIEIPYCVQKAFNSIPLLMKLVRWFIFFKQELIFFVLFSRNSKMAKAYSNKLTDDVKKQLTDTLLREKLLPKYAIGCKRITISNDYLESFSSSKTELMTQSIESITQNGIMVTQDGCCTEIELDVLIYATGFDVKASSLNIDVIGCNAKDLRKCWGDTPNAYLGISCPNFPNYFILLGPNIVLGHNSVVWMIECQAEYLVDGIVNATKQNIDYIEVEEHVHQKYQEYVEQKLKSRVWSSGCTSWYQNAHGMVTSLWPNNVLHYWWLTRAFNFSDYVTKQRVISDSPKCQG